MKDLKADSPYLPSQVYGVDFSGAQKAGSRIWITSALIKRDVLQIEGCFQARDLPGSSAERDSCLQALCHFISSQKASALGLDFPFSLPRSVIRANSWEELVLSFSSHYPDPEQFKAICWAVAGNCEQRRDTDRVSRTPFSPYNARLYRQTYYGIRDVLAPLVRHESACVLPMQRASPDRPWVFEVCPASTLKRTDLYLSPYKRRDMESRVHRERIIEGLERTRTMLIKSSELRLKVLDDWHGDALDSVIAAFATFRALSNPACLSIPGTSAYALEGYVCV